MIGIIVPAHNEEALIAHCLASLQLAAAHPGLRGEAVQTVVVLDTCSDATAELATVAGVMTLAIQAQNVGLARRLGAEKMIAAGADWLAFTDADSVVAPDWLVAQLHLGADAVCGTVAVDQWGAYGEKMKRHFALTYRDKENHNHIHGANLGISAAAYTQAGGFAALTSGEDVALVAALEATGARIAWSNTPRVTTSARDQFRAPLGFGATLAHIEQTATWAEEPEALQA